MKFRVIFLIPYIFFYSSAFSLTGEEAIEKLIERLISIDTMKGQLSLSYQSGETYSGTFMYMIPGKIYVKFTDPPGKFIVTDSKKLWVYDSSTDVCGVQELETEDEDPDIAGPEKESKEIMPKLKGGLERFLRTYKANLLSQGSSAWEIELSNNNGKYSEIKLIIDPEFLSIKAIYKDREGDGFAVRLFDIRIGEKITPGIFNFNVPANAQVVKNPLDIR